MGNCFKKLDGISIVGEIIKLEPYFKSDLKPVCICHLQLNYI